MGRRTEFCRNALRAASFVRCEGDEMHRGLDALDERLGGDRSRAGCDRALQQRIVSIARRCRAARVDGRVEVCRDHEHGGRGVAAG